MAQAALRWSASASLLGQNLSVLCGSAAASKHVSTTQYCHLSKSRFHPQKLNMAMVWDSIE